MRISSITPDTTRNQCSSAKKAYGSEREAYEAKLHGEEKRGIALDVYRCAECGAWHLTSQVGYD